MTRLFLSCCLVLALSACAPPYDPAESARESASDAASEPAVAAAPAAAAVAVAPLAAGEEAALRAALAKTLPQLQVDAVQATPLPGLYEIQVGLNFGYVSQDGRYLIAGDLTDLAAQRELTEERRRGARLALVGGLGEEQTITFAPAGGPARHTVTVFTDIDCGYCRMLHQQMADYHAQGIAVRYLFFPRSGEGTESFHKAEQVWCAADRRAALTQAKAGERLSNDRSCRNPIGRQLQLAGELGLRGTPAIILPNGEVIPGYQPAAQLIKVLEQAATPVAAATPAG